MESEENRIEQSGIMKSGAESGIFFRYSEQEKIRSPRVPRALAVGASTVIILAGIQAASGLVGPMLLALFLAVVLLVPLRWLQKHGCPQFLAFLFVLVCTIVLFVGIIYFVGRSLNDFIGKIPAYKDRIVVKYNQIDDYLERFGFMIGKLQNLLPTQTGTDSEDSQDQIDGTGLPVPSDELLEDSVPKSPADSDSLINIDSPDTVVTVDEGESATGESVTVETVVDTDVPTLSTEETQEWIKKVETEELPLIPLDPQSIAYWLTRAALQVRRMLEGGFLVLIFTIFMLFEASHFPNKVRRAFSKDSPINIDHFHRVAEDIRRYLFLKTLANLMSGSAAMFVYYMFGVPAAFFWGIVAFFMYYIPNIGGTMAAVIPGILIFMIHDITGVLLYTVCLVTIECSIAYGIEPKMLGHGLRLSTLVIISTLFFWGFLLGAIGLFLAAPLTVMIKIILQAFPETRWLAIFLDGNRKDREH